MGLQRYPLLHNGELDKTIKPIGTYEGKAVSAASPISSLSAHLPHINNTLQHFIADKAEGKSSLSANWVQTKSACRHVGAVHPTNTFF